MSEGEKFWRRNLAPDAYCVLREKGTEPAFTGKYVKHKGKGTYVCAACGQELFRSEAKFDSGTGWPSFGEAASQEKVVLKEDKRCGMERTEVLCSKCGGYLGHVFEDGPAPTGKRYCINSLSLGFTAD